VGGDGQGAVHEIPPSDRGVFSAVGEVKLWKGGRYGQEGLSGREAQVELPLG
jgi:hypothetical protein